MTDKDLFARFLPVIRIDWWKACAWFLTLSRVFLLFAIVHFVLLGFQSWTFHSLALFVVVDIFDGRIILLSKAVIEKDKIFRHNFDAILDKIAILVVVVAFWNMQLLPVWAFGTLVSLEIILIFVCLRAYFQKITSKVDFSGRLASLFLAAIAVSTLFGFSSWLKPLLAIYSCLRLVSIRHYLLEATKHRSDKK